MSRIKRQLDILKKELMIRSQFGKRSYEARIDTEMTIVIQNLEK